MERDPYLLQTLSNAIDVLEIFADHPDPLSTSQLVQFTGMNRTNLFRILYTLRKKGLIEVDKETGKYRLGMKLVHLASLVLQRLEVRDIARPHLQRLRDHLQENVHLVVLDQDKVVFVDKYSVTGFMLNSYIGYVAPLYCTASGKLLLQFQDEELIERYIQETEFKPYTKNTLVNKDDFRKELKRIRQQGYSMDDEEIEDGLVGYAAPIFNSNGQVVASVSVSGAAQKFRENKERIVSALLETAKQISADLANVHSAWIRENQLDRA